MSPDLAARKVIIHSFIYYKLDDAINSNPEYEDLVTVVLKGWHEVDPLRQWQLGSKEEIAVSGFNIKYTTASISAANAA